MLPCFCLRIQAHVWVQTVFSSHVHLWLLIEVVGSQTWVPFELQVEKWEICLESALLHTLCSYQHVQHSNHCTQQHVILLQATCLFWVFYHSRTSCKWILPCSFQSSCFIASQPKLSAPFNYPLLLLFETWHSMQYWRNFQPRLTLLEKVHIEFREISEFSEKQSEERKGVRV